MPRKRVWDVERARALYDEGLDDLAIADAVGATESAVAGWRAQNRMRKNKPEKEQFTMGEVGHEDAAPAATESAGDGKDKEPEPPPKIEAEEVLQEQVQGEARDVGTELLGWDDVAKLYVDMGLLAGIALFVPPEQRRALKNVELDMIDLAHKLKREMHLKEETALC